MSWDANDEMTCQRLVEVVTDYLEGAMGPAERLRFEEHIAYCGPCIHYLEQMRQTIAVAGVLREDDLDSASREMMLRVLRDFGTG
jgi:anti-sigma factor RsiW